MITAVIADRHDADKGEVAGDVIKIGPAGEGFGCRIVITTQMMTSATVTQKAWLESRRSQSVCS
jgi:hypothetical protein